jgi:O-antigen/teichoic acid export membrane protein
LDNNSQIKAGAVLSYISMGISTVVSLIYTPIMLSQLGDSEYGVYNLVLPVISYLNLLSLGLGSAYIRYYARYKVTKDTRSQAKMNGMFFVTYTVLGILLVALGFFLSNHGNLIFGKKLTPEEIALGERLLRIMSINAGISFPLSVFESFVTINERYIFLRVASMIKTVLNPIVMIPLLLMGFRSMTMALLALVFTVLTGIVEMYYSFAKLHMPVDFRSYDFRLLKSMMGYTYYIFLSAVVENVNWSIDRLLLGWIRGTAEVTTYVVASQLNIYYLSFSMAIANVLTPRVHCMVAEHRSDRELSRLFTRVGRIQFLLLMAIFLGFVAVGETFVIRWGGGERFAVSYVIALILMATTILPAIQTVGIEIQRAKGMQRFRTYLYLAVCVGNALISIPLTFKWGGIGAALGTILLTILGNVVVMNWYYKNRIGLDIPRFWREIVALVPGMVIPLIVAILMAVFVPNGSYWTVLIFGAIFLAIYCFFMWNFGMNRYEKDLVREPLRRIFGGRRGKRSM